MVFQDYALFPHMTVAENVEYGLMVKPRVLLDEIIVTNFTSGTTETLPKWIFRNLRLPNSRPIVNVVAMVVIVLSILPVLRCPAPHARGRRCVAGWCPRTQRVSTMEDG